MIAEYINNHHAEFWLLLGFALLTIEVLTGLTTGILLFGGCGALITGIIMYTGLLPESWVAGIASTGVCAGLITAVLWRPLKKFQGGRHAEKDNSSDLIGYEFIIEQDITTQAPGNKRYSGIEWRVEISPEVAISHIAAGQRVVVASVDVGIFRVKPLPPPIDA